MLHAIIMPMPMSLPTTDTPTTVLHHCRYYHPLYQYVSAAELTVRRNMKRNIAKKLQGLSGGP